MNRQVLATNFMPSALIQQDAIIQLFLKFDISLNVTVCVKAGFCQIQSQMSFVPNMLCIWDVEINYCMYFSIIN